MRKSEIENAINQFMNDVYRVAFTYCKNHMDAEDITQNTFLKLYQTEKEFESEEHLKNWLLKVCVNNALDLKRNKWNSRESISEFLVYEEKERHNLELAEAIDKLSAKNRLIILLYYYYGYSVKEIAQMTDIRESAVQNRMQRARNKLKAYLQED